MELRERTHAEESDYTLSFLLENLNSSFHHLNNSLSHKCKTELTKLLFIRNNYIAAIRFYAEQAPVESESTKIANSMLIKKRFAGYYVITEEDMPDMLLMKQFKEALAVSMLPYKEDSGVWKGYASRGQNITNLVFITDNAVHDIRIRHCCAENTFSNQLLSESEIAALKHKKKSILILPGKLFACEKCGYELFVDTLDIQHIRKIHPDILLKGSSK